MDVSEYVLAIKKVIKEMEKTVAYKANTDHDLLYLQSVELLKLACPLLNLLDDMVNV